MEPRLRKNGLRLDGVSGKMLVFRKKKKYRNARKLAIQFRMIENKTRIFYLFVCPAYPPKLLTLESGIIERVKRDNANSHAF